MRDWTPLVIFGIATVHKTRLLAMLSGLKLEGELNGFHCSLTHKEKVRGSTRKWSESSLTGQLGQAMVVVLEGVPPNQQYVLFYIKTFKNTGCFLRRKIEKKLILISHFHMWEYLFFKSEIHL